MKRLILVLALAFPITSVWSVWAADAQGLTIGNPIALNSSASSYAYTAFTIDSTAKRVGWQFSSPDAGAFDTFLFRYGVRTGTPVQHRITLQGVNAAGAPDGIILAAAAFTPPPDTTWDGLVQAISVSRDGAGSVLTSYTRTRGAFYSVVIEPCPNSTAPCSGAATPDASNSSSFTTAIPSIGDGGRMVFPTAETSVNSGSVYIKQGDFAVFGYRDGARTYGGPIQSITTSTISKGSEQGMSFNVPSTLWATYKVACVNFVLTSPAAGKTVHINLYSGTTVLQSVSWDTDNTSGAASANRSAGPFCFTGTLATLNTGTTYRIGIAPQDATTGIGLHVLNFASAQDRTAFRGGDMFAYSTRSSCGGGTPAACDAGTTAWDADTTTSRPLMSLTLEDITAPAASDGQRVY